MPKPPKTPVIDPSLTTAALDEIGPDPSLEWVATEFRGDGSNREMSQIDLAGCRFVGAILTASKFVESRIVDTEFIDCEMSGIDFSDASLTRVRFVRCRVSAADLSATRLTDIQFQQCKLDDVNVRMANLARVELVESTLHDADFVGVSGSDVAMYDCDLTRATFTKTKFTALALHGSILDGLIGAAALTSAVIDSNQTLPFAMALLAGHGVRVNDDRA